MDPLGMREAWPMMNPGTWMLFTVAVCLVVLIGTVVA